MQDSLQTKDEHQYNADALIQIKLLGDFKGQVAMIPGAMNMTMTEVQVGHRVGSCDF